MFFRQAVLLSMISLFSALSFASSFNYSKAVVGEISRSGASDCLYLADVGVEMQYKFYSHSELFVNCSIAEDNKISCKNGWTGVIDPLNKNITIWLVNSYFIPIAKRRVFFAPQGKIFALTQTFKEGVSNGVISIRTVSRQDWQSVKSGEKLPLDLPADCEVKLKTNIRFSDTASRDVIPEVEQARAE